MVGTTIKLARALWIVPVAFAVAILKKSKTRIKWPWFILIFLPSCGCEHVFAGVRRGLSKTQRVGKDWLDSHSLSDWPWDLKVNFETSWRASSAAGNLALGDCGNHFYRFHPLWNHRHLIRLPEPELITPCGSGNQR